MDWNFCKDQVVWWVESHPDCFGQQDRKIFLDRAKFGHTRSELARRYYPKYWHAGLGRQGNNQALMLIKNAVNRVKKIAQQRLKQRQQELTCSRWEDLSW